MNASLPRLSQLRRRRELQVTLCEACAEPCTAACRAVALLGRARIHAATLLLAR